MASIPAQPLESLDYEPYMDIPREDFHEFVSDIVKALTKKKFSRKDRIEAAELIGAIAVTLETAYHDATQALDGAVTDYFIDRFKGDDDNGDKRNAYRFQIGIMPIASDTHRPMTEDEMFERRATPNAKLYKKLEKQGLSHDEIVKLLFEGDEKTRMRDGDTPSPWAVPPGTFDPAEEVGIEVSSDPQRDTPFGDDVNPEAPRAGWLDADWSDIHNMPDDPKPTLDTAQELGQEHAPKIINGNVEQITDAA